MTANERIDTDAVFREHPFVREILDRLAEGGHETFLVGGVVRDGLLAAWGEDAVRFPPADVDVTTSAAPVEIRRIFAGQKMVDVGERFGVLVIVGPRGTAVEVATFRSEGGYDGRRPTAVRVAGTLEEDVKRRDLTINGLAATVEGRVIDRVGGVEDLRARRIRAIGDPRIRFSEDYLRMLRVVRFACQIGGEIDPETASAIRDVAHCIPQIAWERIQTEVLRTLELPTSARGIELLDELGLLAEIVPEVSALHGVPQSELYHPEGDVFVHTILAVRVADAFVRDPIVKLAILLHDIGKPAALRNHQGTHMGGHCLIGAKMAMVVAGRLKLTRRDTHRLSFLIRQHMRVADFPRMGRGRQVRFLASDERPNETLIARRYPLFLELLQVLIADCEACAHHALGWAPILATVNEVAEHIDRVGSLSKARELFDGHDLMSMGIPPGPVLGDVLAAVHDRILAGEISTEEQARNWVAGELERRKAETETLS
ncbi:CCA tRNA nucleotidyltransferase [Candidatus Bipolaricaulota bacterium]|nr:CCA tRNA nucleotidyltransferase [Candidatus Bipolaricaulota bacterium]